VGKDVCVVLVGVAQGQGVEVLAKPLDLGVANALGIPRIRELPGQVGRQPKPMIHLAQKQRPGVGGDARIGLTQLDRPVKRNTVQLRHIKQASD
jgi:hypothetical protein